MEIDLGNKTAAVSRRVIASIQIARMSSSHEVPIKDFADAVKRTAVGHDNYFYLGYRDTATIDGQEFLAKAELCKPRIYIARKVIPMADFKNKREIRELLGYDLKSPLFEDIRWVVQDPRLVEVFDPVNEGCKQKYGAIVVNPDTQQILLNTTRPGAFSKVDAYINVPKPAPHG